MSRFNVVPHGHVLEVQFNRPKKGNAFDKPAWLELKAIFDAVHAEITSNPITQFPEGPMKAAADLVPKEADIRCVVVTAQGSNFCSGIDLSLLAEVSTVRSDCVARSGFKTRATVLLLQDCVSSIARCPVPVIMAVHGACYGLGVDLITAGCIRMATKDARFSVKEVDLGVVADVGVLQRLPLVVGNQSLVKTWAYTARTFSAQEAHAAGLISEPLAESKEALRESALALAAVISSKSPTAIAGTKEVLDEANREKVSRGLNYVATLNGHMVNSTDTETLVMASMSKKKKKGAAEPVTFSKL